MLTNATLCLTALLALPLAGHAAGPPVTPPAAHLEFIENRGQWDARARYAAHVGTGARLFVENTGLTYALTGGLPGHAHAGEAAAGPLRGHALRVEFVRPDAGARLLPDAEAPGRHHYLLGADATAGPDARAWRRLHYAGLWPGTDFTLRENTTHQLEYDLTLAPGADPTRPRLRYRGADAIVLDPATGALHVRTSAGTLSETRPVAWQTDPATGARQPVACAFRLRQSEAGAEVSFVLGKYDKKRALTIDPAITFVSYTGSAVENWGFAAAPDAAGNLFTAGVAFAPGYPVTTGAYQTTFAGQVDMAIMKFTTSRSGPSARAWATHLGGSRLEFPHSLLANARGELLILGSTSSADFPTTAGALGRAFRGGPPIRPNGALSPFNLTQGADLTLSRLSADGRRLRASTYLGGTGTDGQLDSVSIYNLRRNYGDSFRGDLAFDPQGNVYVATTTGSSDFPGLPFGAYRGGASDGIVLSLDSTLSRVRWATLLGGGASDAAYSLHRDETSGELWVAGGTYSGAHDELLGSYVPTIQGGADGYVTHLSAAGAVLRTTFLGTASNDQAYFVRRGGPGNKIYVLGQTLSNIWPGRTAGLFGTVAGHQFIQQLEPDLATAGFATTFGSRRPNVDISPTAFDVDCYGRIFLAGWGGGLNLTSTEGLPTTSNALTRVTDAQDFYLMQLSDGARTLDYGSFFGTGADDHVDGGTSRFDPSGTLYQALCACNQGAQAGLPVPAGANTYAPTNGSPNCNNAAFRLAFPANTSLAGPDTLTVCGSGPVPLGGSPAGGTWTGTGVSGTVATGFFFTPDTTYTGAYVLTYTSPLTGLCASVTNRPVVAIRQPIAKLSVPDKEVCLQPGPPPGLVPLTASPPGGVFGGPGVVPGPTPGTFVFDPALAGPGQHAVSYRIAGGRCPSVAAVTINVRGTRQLTLTVPRRVCANDPPVPLLATPGGGVWTGTGVSLQAGAYVFTPSPALVGMHVLTYAVTGDPICPGFRDTTSIRVRAVAGTVTAPPDTTVCALSAPFRLRPGVPAGGTWSGPGVSGSRALGFTFTPSAALAGKQTLTYTGFVADSTQCPPKDKREVTLLVRPVQLSVAKNVLCPQDAPEKLMASPAGGTWSGPGVSGNATAGYFFTPSAALAGTQTLTYTTPQPPPGSGLCAGAGQLQVIVVSLPALYFEPIPPVRYCRESPPHGIVLRGQPAGGTFSGPGVTGNRFDPSATGPGQFTLTYTYTYLTVSASCPITTTQTVDVGLYTPLQLPPDTVLCGDPQPFRLRASPTGGSWSGPGVTAAGMFAPPATPGTSVLTYSLPDGCGSQTYRVTVAPGRDIAADWQFVDCPGNPVAPRRLRFTATGPEAAQVRWDFGDGSPAETGAVVEHTYTTAGTAIRPVASLPATVGGAASPCRRLATLRPFDVAAPALPNIITPNADGLNDTFRPRLGGCGERRLQVFSRWGRAVHDQANYQDGWDASDLPDGLYFYLLSGESGEQLAKGWVEVAR